MKTDGDATGASHHASRFPDGTAGPAGDPLQAGNGAASSPHEADRPATNAAPGMIGGLFDSLQRLARALGGSAATLIEIQSDRIRVSARGALTRAAIAAAAALTLVAWLIAAALALLRGACDGFTILAGGREWMGNLLGGGLALAVGAAAIAVQVHLSSHRELQRLEAKYERIRGKAREGRAAAAPGVDGQGTAEA